MSKPWCFALWCLHVRPGSSFRSFYFSFSPFHACLRPLASLAPVPLSATAVVSTAVYRGIWVALCRPARRQSANSAFISFLSLLHYWPRKMPGACVMSGSHGLLALEPFSTQASSFLLLRWHHVTGLTLHRSLSAIVIPHPSSSHPPARI